MSGPSHAFTCGLVRRLFRGVTDKGGRPYHEHCEWVAAALGDVPDDVWHAAMLHDVLEDTETTADDLRAYGYSERTISLVLALTRDWSVTYRTRIRDIAKSGDRDLIQIKLSDVLANADHSRMARVAPHVRGGLQDRYESARRALQAALDKIAGDPAP